MNWYRVIPFVLFALLPLQAVNAQTNLFATALTVNGQAISNYEIDQRQRMARLLEIPGSSRSEAIDELINERLIFQEAGRLGINLPVSILNDRIEQYAENTVGSASGLYAQLRRNGISREVFREYARASIIWQDVKAARFSAWASLLTEDDLDEQAEFGGKQTFRSINLSELIMTADLADASQTLAQARELHGNITSLAAFREAVGIFSNSPTSNDGGRLGWIPESSLPPAVLAAVRGVNAGTVSRPVQIENSIAMFYVHGRRTNTTGNTLVSMSYATARMPGTGEGGSREIARQAAAGIDTCNDLQSRSASIEGSEYAFHEISSEGEVPGSLSGTLNALDEGEYDIIGEEGSSTVVMLCSRNYLPEVDNQEEQLNSYRQNWVNLTADAYLSRLRADAIIKRK